MGAHYEAISRATGKTIKTPELPAALRYLWNHFAMLHRARGGSGFGPNPLSWSEIYAYCQVTRCRFNPWEIEAIRLLDDAFMVSIIDKQSQD